MRINDLNSLQDHIDLEIAWRKKEILWQREQLFNKNDDNKYLLRAAILILYSHWEGSIKKVGEYYLCYIKCQNLKYEDLNHNFFGILLFQKYKKIGTSKQFKDFNLCVLELEKEKVYDYYKVIPAESNLKSDVFENILNLIGVSIEKIELDKKLIDEVLLKKRNKIAHGERFDGLDIDAKRFMEISNKVLNTIEIFCNTIMYYAINEKYLR